jgi:hypothetical protein
LTLGRIRLTGLRHATARVTLDLHREPYDSDELWLSLTPAEARHLAAGLLSRAAAAERETTDAGGEARNRIEVGHVTGESYGITVRGHEVLVDQPGHPQRRGQRDDGDQAAGRLSRLVRGLLRRPLLVAARHQS